MICLRRCWGERREKKRKRRRGRKKNVEEGGRGRRGWGVIESGSLFSYVGLLIHAWVYLRTYKRIYTYAEG